jgi:hypothetical protein
MARKNPNAADPDANPGDSDYESALDRPLPASNRAAMRARGANSMREWNESMEKVNSVAGAGGKKGKKKKTVQAEETETETEAEAAAKTTKKVEFKKPELPTKTPSQGKTPET